MVDLPRHADAARRGHDRRRQIRRRSDSAHRTRNPAGGDCPRLAADIAMTKGLAIGQRRFDRRRTPTILQIEAVECGAAALAMVLAAHGGWAPLMELRRLCGISRDGSRASNMLRAARGLGMEAKGFRVSSERIAQVPVP